MPQIPVYQQQVAPRGNAVAAQGPNLAGEFNLLSNSLARAGDAWSRKLAADAAADAGAISSQAEAFWAQEELKRRQSVQPGAPDYTESVMRDFADYRKGQEQRASSETARAFLRERFDSLENRLRLSSVQFEAQEGVRRRISVNETANDEGFKTVRAKPELFTEILAARRAAILASGLDPQVTEQLLEQAQAGLASAAAITFVEKDPRKALEALRKAPGESGLTAVEALPSRQREAAISMAETEIRRLEAEERARQAEARAVATAQATALRDYMSDALESYSMGFGLPANYSEARLAIAGLPDDNPQKQRLLRQDAVLSSLDQSGFLSLNPTQQAEQLTALEAQMQDKGANSVSIDLLKLGRTIQAETDRRVKADPFAFAVQRGIVAAPEQTGDFQTDLKARAEAARKASAYLGKQVPGFTAPELENIAERYAAGSLDDRTSLLFAITDTHGQRQASVVFEALDKQGHTGMALAGALAMEAPDAARLVVRGQQALAEGGKANLVPKDIDMREALRDELGNAYGLGTKARATIESGILSAYAALSAESGDNSGGLDSNRLTAAVNAVTGGLVEYQGRRFPAPKRGVSQQKFEDWVDALESADFARVAGIPSAYAFDAWRREGWLEAVGPNQYVPVIEGPSGPVFLVDAQGQPIRLSYDGRTKRKPFLDQVIEGFGSTR